MNREKVLSELAIETNTKIVLLVLDGLGDIPVHGKTPLEAAHAPNLHRLALESSCGLTVPVFPGITPGSGPAHLALFGYDPTEYFLGRGILEALGVGVEVGKDDLVARGNFATLKDGLVVDRRAGRIPTSDNALLCQRINGEFKSIKGVSLELYPGKEHRFVIKFSGQGLSDALTDADPQKNNKPRTYATQLNPEAGHTASAVNGFLDRATDLLADQPRANTVLLRGFSKHPSLPSLQDLYKLRAAAVATYPMYKGLARLVGMDILDAGQDLEEHFAAVEKHFNDYTFFYIHFKRPDSAGEDGLFDAKKTSIEDADRQLPQLLALQPEVLVVTSDHSTPCPLKSHSWHPNPFLLSSSASIPDQTSRFTERECARGYLGQFPAVDAMPLMLAHAGKLKKYGA